MKGIGAAVLVGAVVVAAYAFGSGSSFAAGWSRSNGVITKGKRYRISMQVPPGSAKSEADIRAQFALNGSSSYITAVYLPGAKRPGDWPTEDANNPDGFALDFVAPTDEAFGPISNLMVWVQN